LLVGKHFVLPSVAIHMTISCDVLQLVQGNCS